jgi:hypothetical protein
MASFNHDGKAKEFIFFHNRRKVINLYKQYLFMLEDLKEDYDIPDEIYERNRKRVLDYGNDTIRELEENLEKFEIYLK